MDQPVRYKLAQPRVPGNLRGDLLQMVLRLAPMATRTFRLPREHAVFCCHYSSVQFYFVAAREVLSDTGGMGSRLYFCCFTEGAGRRRAWHNNLINLKSVCRRLAYIPREYWHSHQISQR